MSRSLYSTARLQGSVIESTLLCNKSAISRKLLLLGTAELETHLVIYARHIASPFAVIFLKQNFRNGFSAGDDLAQRVEIAGFIITAGVQAIARCQAG